mgnify:CR=1 FL=1
MKIERTYLQGEDPRALSQRDLSRHRRLRRGRGVAALFRQVGARTDGRRKRPISRRCRRRRTTTIRSASASARSSGATTCIDRMVEDRYITRAGRREGEEGAAQRHAAADRRAHLRGRIFRRGGAPLHQRQLRREEALRGRAVGAHHARSEAAGAGAQGADRRLGELRRDARAIAARSASSRSPATGASSSPRSRRCPTSRRGGSRWCSKSSDQSARIGFQPAREPGGARRQASARSASCRSRA